MNKVDIIIQKMFKTLINLEQIKINFKELFEKI